MSALSERLMRAARFQVAGNLLRVALGMGASLLIVRWLGIGEFGKAGFIVSAVLYVSILGSAGLGIPFVNLLTTYRLEGRPEATALLLKRIVTFRLGVVAVFLILWLVSRLLPDSGLGRADVMPLLIYIPFLALTSYMLASVTRLLTAYYDQGYLSIIASLEIVLKLGLTWLLGRGTPTAKDLLLGTILAEALITLLSYTRARTRIGLVTPWQRIKNQPFKGLSRIKTAKVPGIRQLLALGRQPYFLSLALRIIGKDIDILLIGMLVGPEEIVRYMLPFSLSLLTISIASSALNSTTLLCAFREAAAQGGDARTSRLLRSLFEFWLLFVVPIAVGGALVGGRLLVVLYGETGAGLTTVAGLLFAAGALGELASLGKDALQALDHHRGPMRAYLSGGGINLALSLLLIPVYGAEGAAAATLAGMLVIVFLTYRELAELLVVRLAPRPIWVSAGAATTMIAVVIWAGQQTFSWPTMASLALQITAGAALYGALLFLLQPQTVLREAIPYGNGKPRFIQRFF
jgi:O-antigen/teichoic acid export membrane protein